MRAAALQHTSGSAAVQLSRARDQLASSAVELESIREELLTGFKEIVSLQMSAAGPGTCMRVHACACVCACARVRVCACARVRVCACARRGARGACALFECWLPLSDGADIGASGLVGATGGAVARLFDLGLTLEGIPSTQAWEKALQQQASNVA